MWPQSFARVRHHMDANNCLQGLLEVTQNVENLLQECERAAAAGDLTVSELYPAFSLRLPSPAAQCVVGRPIADCWSHA